jgi:hypothetical protein
VEAGELIVDRFAELLVDIAARRRGRGMATVERIVTGPTTRTGASWLAVLYRNSEVEGGEQLIGYGRYVSEDRNTELSSDQCEYLAHDIWNGDIDEPPGNDLPDGQLVPGGVAWWERCAGWTVDHGPFDGLPATRTHIPDPSLGDDIVVWAAQPQLPDADHSGPEASADRIIRKIAVQADCSSLGMAESSTDGITSIEDDDQPSSYLYLLSGTAVMSTSSRPLLDGSDRTYFVISVGDVRFLAVAPADMIGTITSGRVTVRCTLSIVNNQDWNEYGFPDPQANWVVHARGASFIRDGRGDVIEVRDKLQLSPLLG